MYGGVHEKSVGEIMLYELIFDIRGVTCLLLLGLAGKHSSSGSK
jgi:hypothetical protein